MENGFHSHLEKVSHEEAEARNAAYAKANYERRQKERAAGRKDIKVKPFDPEIARLRKFPPVDEDGTAIMCATVA